MLNADKVLAELGLSANNGPCELHLAGTMDADRKFLLSEVEAATTGESAQLRSGMYMLLSLTLELWRRNEYAFKALHASLGDAGFDQADPEYAARIYLHNKGLHSFEDPRPGATDWKARAEMANDIVHNLLAEVEQPHARALKLGVTKTEIFSVFASECAAVPGLKRLVDRPGLLRDDAHGHAGPMSGPDEQLKKAA